MKCLTCGNDNPADARFCGGCGASLGVSTASGLEAAFSEIPMVSFIDAIKLGFSNYSMFSKRSTRAEYWWWGLFVTSVVIVLSVVDSLTGTMGMVGNSGLLSGLFQLAILIPSFALGARRLHDINRSGWWQLLWFVVVIGWIVLIAWAIRKGHEGPNQHGRDPRQATSQQLNEPW